MRMLRLRDDFLVLWYPRYPPPISPRVTLPHTHALRLCPHRDEAAKAEKAKRAAIAANQRARQELGAREREAAAREQEKQEEAARRAAERNRTAAEKVGGYA